MRRAQKDAKMNSCGCGEGPIENAFLQGPEFCATPLVELGRRCQALEAPSGSITDDTESVFCTVYASKQ